MRRSSGSSVADAKLPGTISVDPRLQSRLLMAEAYTGTLRSSEQRPQPDSSSPWRPTCRPVGPARLIVRDSGPGIRPELGARIFDPFVTTKAGGTGLGLPVSYGIVRDRNGPLDFESQSGAGARFIATFPAGMGAPA